MHVATCFRYTSAADVLAVVLCPARAFGDRRAAARLLLPMKTAIIRRFVAARVRH